MSKALDDWNLQRLDPFFQSSLVGHLENRFIGK